MDENNSIYIEKYLKYKAKYLKLKNELDQTQQIELRETNESGYESEFDSDNELDGGGGLKFPTGMFNSMGKSLGKSASKFKSSGMASIKKQVGNFKNNPKFKQFTKNPQFKQFMKNPNLQQMMQNPQLQQMMSPQMASPQMMSPQMASPQMMGPQMMGPQMMGPQMVSPPMMPVLPPKPLLPHQLVPPVDLSRPDSSSPNIINLKREQLTHNLNSMVGPENSMYLDQINIMLKQAESKPNFIALLERLLQSIVLIINSNGTIDLPTQLSNINTTVL